MTIMAYTDGASRGNPGESGIGVILKDEDGNVLSSKCGYIGKATNNTAEYVALATCLKIAQQMKCDSLIVHSDSELMVRQMNGQYKVRDAGLKKHFQTIQQIISALPFPFVLRHVPREKNHEADELANRGIDMKQRLRM